MTNRRDFLQAGGAGIAGAALLGRVATASQKSGKALNLALIGCGGQGTNLLRRFLTLPDVTITHVCDPDDSHAQRAAKLVASASGKAPKVEKDLRKVLDDKSVDAVIVATPDHWHAPAAILACQAGKHVYVEKPCSHNFREGKILVEAASKHQRIVQHGTQSRSMPMIVRAIQALREGIVGDVLVAKAVNVQKRANIGRAKPSEPPAGFDYDLWVGPAPMVPFQSNRHHYTWHWWYDFGTGDMGNDGVHELDIARWGLGVEGHPSKISAMGGKLYFDDDQQFPDTQMVGFDYPGPIGKRKQLVFEMRIWSPYQPDEVENGNLFYGTDGWMLLTKRGSVKVFDAKGKPKPYNPELPKHLDHQEEFLAAIRENRAPSADIALGFPSAALCHLGNLATRLGRTIDFDPKSETIPNDREANALLGRTYREGHWAIPKTLA